MRGYDSQLAFGVVNLGDTASEVLGEAQSAVLAAPLAPPE